MKPALDNPWQTGPSPERIQELACEHAEILRMLSEINEMLDEARYDAALTHASALRDRLVEHRRSEETDIYPALDRALGDHLSPSGEMLSEHDREQELFEEFEACASGGDVDSAVRVAKRLIGSVRDHLWKEDNLVFPFVMRAARLARRVPN